MKKMHRSLSILLALLALFAFVAMGTSCKKDEAKTDQDVTAAQKDKDAGAKADDKKADDKKADDAKADDKKADDAAPEGTDDAANADGKKDGGKYPLFKFTLKYTPTNARVGAINGTVDCKDGVCTVESTSETEALQVSAHVEGYESKTVTITEKPAGDYELNLVALPPEEKK